MGEQVRTPRLVGAKASRHSAHAAPLSLAARSLLASVSRHASLHTKAEVREANCRAQHRHWVKWTAQCGHLMGSAFPWRCSVEHSREQNLSRSTRFGLKVAPHPSQV
jgi:hypothetical protein